METYTIVVMKGNTRKAVEVHGKERAAAVLKTVRHAWFGNKNISNGVRDGVRIFVDMFEGSIHPDVVLK